jgi:hypothetical protein
VRGERHKHLYVIEESDPRWLDSGGYQKVSTSKAFRLPI